MGIWLTFLLEILWCLVDFVPVIRQGETAVAQDSDKPGKKETSNANGKKQPQSTDTGE